MQVGEADCSGRTVLFTIFDPPLHSDSTVIPAPFHLLRLVSLFLFLLPPPLVQLYLFCDDALLPTFRTFANMAPECRERQLE